MGNGTYTISYVENGKTYKIQVEKGVKLQGSSAKDSKGGVVPTIDFKTDGKNNAKLNKASSTEIALLKTLEGADKKPGISKADVKKMYDIFSDGRLTPYVNARTPEGVKSSGFNPTNTNTPGRIELEAHDSKAHKSYEVDATTD